MAKKIHRFITKYKINKNILTIEDINTIHQIKDVLRLKLNEECIIVDEITNENIHCSITDINKEFINLEIKDVSITKDSDLKDVTLYMAILKKENFELVLQKASEMGINKIVPIITNRTIKTNLKYERLDKIAREASELSGRGNVTQIAEITNFTDAIKNDTNTVKVLFDITGENFPFQDIQLKQDTEKSISIYIGPEGGFTEIELNQIKENKDFTIYNLGPLTLRGETAAIIGCYLALQ